MPQEVDSPRCGYSLCKKAAPQRHGQR